jgi:hypothetical protein
LSNTTKNGTPNPPTAAARPVSLRVLLWSILTLILALFVATQVIGVLYAIIFPPNGPALPLGITQLSHRNDSPGVDYWEYGTEQNACELLSFFAAQGGTCQNAPFTCGGTDGVVMANSSPAQQVGRCTGEMDFSIFTLRWRVGISTFHYTGGTTHFSLMREVYWLGQRPIESTPSVP